MKKSFFSLIVLTLYIVLVVCYQTNYAENPSCDQQNPNAYPSVNMGRYEFIRHFYPMLSFIADCYFGLVNAVFGLINAFKPVETVEWENADKVLFYSAEEAAERIRKGSLTSRELFKAYIERISSVQPLLGAVYYAYSLQVAEQRDKELAKMTKKERENLKWTKPFYGVPFTVKANLMVKGMATSACNIYLKWDKRANVNAPIVQRMMDAGAVLLAVTTMPNLGLSWAGDDTGGCLPTGMTINNPHDSRRMTGGSSSGEGALISAAGSVMGMGNDIGGSVRVPASMTGIFGLKPTNYPSHTVPVEGIVPNFAAYKPAKDMLTNGPLVRYATDLHLVLSVMANKPINYYYKNVNFAKNFKLYYLEDVDILIAEKLHDEQRDQVRKVKKYFEESYNLTVQKVEFPLMNRLFELFYLNDWSNQTLKPSEVLPEFLEIHYGKANHTFLDWEFHIMHHLLAPKDEKEKEFVAGKLKKFRREVNELLGEDGLLLLPLFPTPVPYHHMEPFESFNLYYTMTWNLLGNPALAAPIGKSPITNMPLGVQFVASNFNEALLISMAREMEKAFGGWVVPGLKKGTNLNSMMKDEF